MTDFIMEQELSLAPEPKIPEKTDEELAVEIVESFMNMSAAFSNIECMFEYAKIAEFCKDNKLQMPISIVTEGFKEFAAKAVDVIATVFEWIRTFIASLSNFFTKIRLKRLIAKIETIDWNGMDKNVKAKLEKSLISASLLGGIVTVALFGFLKVLENLKALCTDDYGKTTISKDLLRPAIAMLADGLSTLTNPFNIIESIKNANTVKQRLLDFFNYIKMSIPPDYQKIFDIFDVIKNIGTEISSGVNLAKNIVVPILKVMLAANVPVIVHNASLFLISAGFDKNAIDELKAKDILDNETVLSIRKCTRILARTYDLVTTGTTMIMSFKLLKHKVADKSKYIEIKSKYKGKKYQDLAAILGKELTKDLEEIPKKFADEFANSTGSLKPERVNQIQDAIHQAVETAVTAVNTLSNGGIDDISGTIDKINKVIDYHFEEYRADPMGFSKSIAYMLLPTPKIEEVSDDDGETVKLMTDENGEKVTPEEYARRHPEWQRNFVRKEIIEPPETEDSSDPENTDNVHNIDEFE